MHVALESLELEHLYVIYPGEHVIPLTGSITVISLAEAIRSLQQM
ncbi:MAG: hypothetical protein AAF236_02005 [Verrucomicrobiota bacterium]